MKLINRASYMDTLTSLICVPDIKVITGIRRSGKSKLLESLRDFIEATLPDSNVIHINYNLDEFENLLEFGTDFFANSAATLLICKLEQAAGVHHGSGVGLRFNQWHRRSSES